MEALKLSTPDQKIKDIQSIDRNLIKDVIVIGKVDEIITAINYFESQKTQSGSNETVLAKINQNISTLNSILDQRIRLTATIMGITEATHILTPSTQDIDLNSATPEENMMKSEAEHDLDLTIKPSEQQKHEDSRKSKVIDGVKKFKKAAEAETTAVEKHIFFKGYERKAVFGTPIELSKEIQALLPEANTESKIDEIAFMLINEKRYEDALNLSLDLFYIAFPAKSQEEIEKRFLFEVIPYFYAVPCEPKETMENVTLHMWCDQFYRKSLEKVYEDGKQKTVIAPNYTEHTVKEQSHVQDAEIVAMTLSVLRNECLVMLRSEEKELRAKAFPHFKNNIKNVTDITDEQRKTFGPLWQEIAKESKKLIETSKEEVTTEVVDKEKIVEAAHQAAEEGKEDLTLDQLKEGAKEIIKKSLLDRTINAMNEVRKLFSSNKKKLDGKKIAEVFKDMKAEVIAENPDFTKKKEETPQQIIQKLNVEEKHPDVWESAKLCKTIQEFEDLLRILVYEKNSFMIASNLSDQYLNNFKETEKHDEAAKITWFANFMKNEATKREAVKEEATQPTENTESKQEESAIAKESDSKRIKQLVAEHFAANSTVSFEDNKAKMLKQLKLNKKWIKAPIKDVENFLNNTINNNPELKKLIPVTK